MPFYLVNNGAMHRDDNIKKCSLIDLIQSGSITSTTELKPH